MLTQPNAQKSKRGGDSSQALTTMKWMEYMWAYSNQKKYIFIPFFWAQYIHMCSLFFVWYIKNFGCSLREPAMTHMPKKKDQSSGVKTKVQAFRPTAEQKFQQCQWLWQTEEKKKWKETRRTKVGKEKFGYAQVTNVKI